MAHFREKFQGCQFFHPWVYVYIYIYVYISHTIYIGLYICVYLEWSLKTLYILYIIFYFIGSYFIYIFISILFPFMLYFFFSICMEHLEQKQFPRGIIKYSVSESESRIQDVRWWSTCELQLILQKCRLYGVESTGEIKTHDLHSASRLLQVRQYLSRRKMMAVSTLMPGWVFEIWVVP